MNGAAAVARYTLVELSRRRVLLVFFVIGAVGMALLGIGLKLLYQVLSSNPNSFGTNNQGDIVGGSINGDVATGSSRAILWHNGVMTDINTLAPNSPLYLLVAFGINDAGQIVGFGASATGEIHGFLATPVHSADY